VLMSKSGCAVVAALATAMIAPIAAPAHAADFYQGKTLSVFVNFTAGGPTDVEARLLARHLSKHIAGAPAIVVRNMGGAGGVIGVNWLGEIAPPDGLTLGYLTGAASKSAIGESGIRVDLGKFAFVAGGPGISVTYIRTDVAPGIKKPADIMKASGFWAGGLAPDADKDVRERMQLDMLGLKYHYISNYPGSAEARLALERKEIQMFPESMPTYRSNIEPNLVKPGVAIPVWYDPLDDGEHFTASPDAQGIPAKMFPDFLKEVGREPPKGELWDAYRLINSVGTVFLRILVMPPNTPREAVAAIQAALVKVEADPEFRADAMKTIKFVPRYLVDDRTEKLYRAKLSPEPRLRAFIHKYVEAGRAHLGK
jgi:tripartite-type tricarboxylate transporter receptor subunit TctC